jgi:hypothetical protein
MTTASATAAQRLEARDEAVKVAALLQGVVQVAQAPSAAKGALVDAALTPLTAALAALGSTTALLPTQQVVANGDTVNVENSAGALDSAATATVAAGVLTDVKLASTKTILTHALKFSGVTITGSGTFFTPTVVDGVLTGGVLSAS